MEKKITNKDYYMALKTAVSEMESVGGLNTDDVIAFLDGKVEQIEKKAARAQERRANAEPKDDPIMPLVWGALNDEFQTRDMIEETINDPEVTVNKITARLTKLVVEGKAVKEQMSVGGKTVMSYKLA